MSCDQLYFIANFKYKQMLITKSLAMTSYDSPSLNTLLRLCMIPWTINSSRMSDDFGRSQLSRSWGLLIIPLATGSSKKKKA